MNNTIHFYFDFTSPYGYLASERIEKIASDLDGNVIWHPILLGAVFKITGQKPLTDAPLKGEYSLRDFARAAREHDLEYQHPSNFPVAAVAASRASIWLRDHQDTALQAKNVNFIHSIYRGYFAEGKDITDTALIAKYAEQLDIDSQRLLEAISTQQIKDALRQEVEQSIAAGVFGSPMMIVNNEPFWGHDRLEQMERWIRKGGW